MELDLEARLMGEALILNRSQNPKLGDFHELNDLNEQLEVRNHENEYLGPTIEEGEVIDEPMIDIVEIRHDNRIVEKIDEYPSFCNYDRKIHINCAYNLQFYCMIGYEHFWRIWMLTEKDIGDVIFGKLFCKDAGVEARWFDVFITIHNGNDNVTYQMAQSHPRKFAPISKAERFLQRSLELGPEYIRDEKMFEWLTRGHDSIRIIFMDTAYGRRGIRRIGNCEYAFSCEDLALIRRISFPGYGVLYHSNKAAEAYTHGRNDGIDICVQTHPHSSLTKGYDEE
ncbi:hypothetical protein Tco_0451026 [Tanacetum coccineum]